MSLAQGKVFQGGNWQHLHYLLRDAITSGEQVADGSRLRAAAGGGGRGQAGYRRGIPAGYRPDTGRIPVGYRPDTGRIPAGYRRGRGKSETIMRSREGRDGE